VFERIRLSPFYVASLEDVMLAPAPTIPTGKVHVRHNEKITESICVVGDSKLWNQNRWVPGAWERVKSEVILDQKESALRLKRAFPSAKILMTIREQVDWLHSSYKFFMPRLPNRMRSFSDFCKTPRGVAYLKAGHFDETIEAYAEVFGADRIAVLRFEDIKRAPEAFSAQLCAYLNIGSQPLPNIRANEGSTAQVARIRRAMPMVDRLPTIVRKAGKRLTSMLPKQSGIILSDNEINMIRDRYAKSNSRTDKLLAELMH
jgi:hypothetical protein